MNEIRTMKISDEVPEDTSVTAAAALEVDALQPELDAEIERTRKAASEAADAKAQAEAKAAEADKLNETCRAEFTSNKSKFTAEERQQLSGRINQYRQIIAETESTLKSLDDLGHKKWSEFANFPHRHAPRVAEEQKEEKEESKIAPVNVPECNGLCPPCGDTEVQVQCTRCGVWVAIESLVDQTIQQAHENAPFQQKMLHQFVAREFGA